MSDINTTENPVVEEKTAEAAAPAPAAATTNERPAQAERPERPRYDRNMRGRKKKKVCSFCVDRIIDIDYKDVSRLKRFMSERAKILPRRITGTCAGHQRKLTVAIKRARQVALLPFVSE